MKSCIYQKQEPVDIPHSETRNLEDVLQLPFGFEIHALLARWNPLNIRRPYTRAPTGKKVLVVGLGPAGYTLSHYLLQEGHTVVAIDGLKIEPLPASLSGREIDGQRIEFEAIRDVSQVSEDLDNRVMAGFGGVSEYGITVRWNKNYLKMLRIMLERQAEFRMYGGIRFGNDSGTLTIDDALENGFDHIALCLGAGRPTVIEMENGFAMGVRQASDFLMALQLSGAARNSSIANLQIRMPIVVVGGGLTAIDTATESLAYYMRQVERYARRHQALVKLGRQEEGFKLLSESEREIAREFITHGEEVIREKENAARENRSPNLIALAHEWGGATIVYRRRLIDSPAYVLNHEEVIKALEEGIFFSELNTPVKVEVDQAGSCTELHCINRANDKESPAVFRAGSILIAAGTAPNTVLTKERSETDGAGGSASIHEISMDTKFFAAMDETGSRVKPIRSRVKTSTVHVLMHRFADGRSMSFFGDLHPTYSGNVVKAMASAKDGYMQICKLLQSIPSANNETGAEFFQFWDRQLIAKTVITKRLTHNILEVVIHAPQAAKHFHPGQFYRLQNFESFAPHVLSPAGEITLAMEGLALTGAWVDKARGNIGFIVLEMGSSSNLCTLLRPGEPVVLMGPTGSPTVIKNNETVLLAGGGLGNAVLFSIGAAFRAAGSRVLYFAAYRGNDDRYHVADIEAAADVIVWCCDQSPGFKCSANRPQDRSYVGNIVEAMIAYANDDLGECEIPMHQVRRIIAIGSDKMMAAVAKARHGALKDKLASDHIGIGSINSPMQCMMKEICSQCIQLHHDQLTGKPFHVYSCFNQDQNLDTVDWSMLADRLRQNRVQERQSAAIVEYCLEVLRDDG